MMLDFEDESMLCDMFHVLFDTLKCDFFPALSDCPGAL